jgi:hypothetical protein
MGFSLVTCMRIRGPVTLILSLMQWCKVRQQEEEDMPVVAHFVPRVLDCLDILTDLT